MGKSLSLVDLLRYHLRTNGSPAYMGITMAIRILEQRRGLVRRRPFLSPPPPSHSHLLLIP